MTIEAEETPKSKQLHFALLLLLSFLIYLAGVTIDQTFRWTNHFDGFMNGLFQGRILGVAWCLTCVLPWSLILFGLYRWRGWERFRTHWILAPSVLIGILAVASLITHPPSPANRFKRFAKTELPTNAQNLNFYFSGGGFADYGDTYYFKTTPKEVDRLISDLKLVEDNFDYEWDGLSHMPISPLPGSPDFSTWEGRKQFRGWDERGHWFYYLMIDSTRSHVYIMIGCI